MFKWIKQLFCNHRFEKTTTSRSERCLFDNLIIHDHYYRCKDCGKIIIMEEVHEVEHNYYLNHY